jgi:Lipase (class 3)
MDKQQPLLEPPTLCGVFPMSYTFPSPKSTDDNSSTTSFDVAACDWPNLYEEAYEMNLVSIIFYGLIDLRNLARQDQLTASDPADIEALLHLPISADRIVRMVARNRERIIQYIGEENTEAYVKAFDAIVRDEALELEFDPETGKSTLVSFDVVKVDDVHQEEELVYGVCVDSARTRITVVFRGCSSRRDWRISADNYLSEYSYQGTTVAMHRGFSQYLFDQNSSSNKTPYEAIFETVRALLKIHPRYYVYVTGEVIVAAG